MAWRNQETHQEETKAVKAALTQAHIPFTKVGHGTGTAWGWLHIKLDEPWVRGHDRDREVIRVVQEATGRHGDYDGCINVSYAR